jgi:hypothetical protein
MSVSTSLSRGEHVRGAAALVDSALNGGRYFAAGLEYTITARPCRSWSRWM